MPPRKRSNRKLSELYIWFKRHWAIRTIIGFLPSVWIPIVLSQSGKAIGIVLPDGKWTILAWLPTIIIYLLSIVFLLSTNSAANQEDDLLEAQMQAKDSLISIHKHMIESLYTICDRKYDKLLTNMSAESYYSDCRQIEMQIKEILVGIQGCLREVLHKPASQIIVTLAYQRYSDNRLVDTEWRWLNTRLGGTGSTRCQLGSNHRSTFYHVVKGDSNFLFYNDKDAAIKENCYVPSAADNRQEQNGSIICKRIIVANDTQKYMMAVLNISTNGFKFVQSNQDDEICTVRENLQTLLLPEFEKRLQIELANLVILTQCFDSIK